MAYYPALSLQQSFSSSRSSGAPDTRAWRRNQNTVRHRFGMNLGPVSNAVIIAIMLCLLGLIYLTQVTRSSTYGYQINDLQQKQQALLSQQADLEVENARLQSLEHVQQTDVAKAMTTPSEVNYIQ